MDTHKLDRIARDSIHRSRSESLRVAGCVLEDHAGLFALAVGLGLRFWVL